MTLLEREVALPFVQQPLRTGNRLRADAHHEAGHAIAAMELKYKPIKHVKLGNGRCPTTGEGYLGVVEFDAEPRMFSQIPYDELFDIAVISLVGPYAELHDQRHRNNPEYEDLAAFWMEGGAALDRDQAQDVLLFAARNFNPGSRDTDRTYFTAEERAKAEELFVFAHERAKTFVVEHWCEIRKLAIELQKRRVMTGEEIWEFMTT